jgi:serine phosphatase RsbU (regulator of sigma subunit)
MNQSDTLFSEERLIQLLEKTQECPLSNVLEQVGIALKEWHSSTEFEDDITLLAIERL